MSEVFATIHAAALAHVAPWELEQQPMYWRSHILEKAAIEADVARVRADRERRNRARQGRR